MKPHRRPEPTFDPPVTLDEIHPLPEVTYVQSIRELIYNLSRSGVFCNDESKVLPWSIFQSSLNVQSKPEVSNVAFNPIIMATPTNHSTIYTTMIRSKEVVRRLGYTFVPVCFDLGLLNKALEIQWSRDDLNELILYDGGMHLIWSVITGIGFLYSDLGLSNLLHESGVYAMGTVNRMLSGRDFDCGIHGLELVDEVLNIQLLIQFKKWCNDNDEEIPNELYDLIEQLNEAVSRNEQCVNIVQHIQNMIEYIIDPFISRYKEEGRQASPTFKLWDDFLVRVMQPFKMYMSSTRNANWNVHQATKSLLLPLLFASSRTNYSRYLPVHTDSQYE